MHPVVCLDRGFSSQFDGEFARGEELVRSCDRSQGAWIVFGLRSSPCSRKATSSLLLIFEITLDQVTYLR